MNLKSRILGHPVGYRLWQAPFAEAKLRPVYAHNDLRSVRRVLDVGCGPGTNTHHFSEADYLGIDYNPAYIDSARRRHRRDFIVADVTTYTDSDASRFDFVLLNSFLHHVDDAGVKRILSHLSTLLTADGHIHILDLVLPPRRSIARSLARLDRGRFARPLEEWAALFAAAFVPVVVAPFRLTALGLTLWNMVYFKGKCKS